MKTRGCIFIFALLLAPLVTRAQSDPNLGAVNSEEGPVEVIVAQKSLSEAQPPPVGATDRKQVEVHVVATGPMGEGTMGPTRFGPRLGAWWKNSEIVSRLQLSQEQVNKVSQTYLEHKLKLIDLQADLDKQELRLQPLMDIDLPDANKVGAQIDLITAARGKLEKENAMMMLDIRRWLSVEQWKKLKSLEAAQEEKQNVFYYRTGGPAGMEGPQATPPPGDLPVMGIPAIRKPPQP
jgi:Spy/CpxP family protein refolding chaperone